MLIIIILGVAVVVFLILLDPLLTLKNFLEEKYFDSPRRKRAEKKCMEKSKKIQGVYIVECLGTSYCYQNGRKINSQPIYKKPDGTYCTYDAPTHRYVGYSRHGHIDNGYVGGVRKKVDKYGKYCSQVDRHGNEYELTRTYSRNYVPNEEEETYSFNNTSYDSGSSSSNDDAPYPVEHRVDWRSDGSYGDIYSVGGQSTDEWGNPL